MSFVPFFIKKDAFAYSKTTRFLLRPNTVTWSSSVKRRSQRPGRIGVVPAGGDVAVGEVGWASSAEPLRSSSRRLAVVVCAPREKNGQRRKNPLLPAGETRPVFAVSHCLNEMRDRSREVLRARAPPHLHIYAAEPAHITGGCEVGGIVITLRNDPGKTTSELITEIYKYAGCSD